MHGGVVWYVQSMTAGPFQLELQQLLRLHVWPCAAGST